MPFQRDFTTLGDCDVSIVGAGVAGLAVASSLMGHGATMRVLEARNRIGGRAYTDQLTFGVPFDRGCTYLASGPRNPLINFARKNSVEVLPLAKASKSKVWVKDREASAEEYYDIELCENAVERALLSAGRRGVDLSARDALGRVGPSKWSAMIESWFELGCEFEQASVLDWYNNKSGTDFICPSGLGDLVARFGADIPVSLNSTVREIDWSGKAVKVVTDNGTLTSRFCVVTVPVAVLAAGGIRFFPSLPGWKLQAIESMVAANYVTVGLQFSEPHILPVESNAWFIPWQRNEGTTMFLNDAAGRGLCRAETGGQAAIDILALGEQGAIDFAVAELAKALGSNVVRKLVKGATTNWTSDPFSRGAWAWAPPGYSHLRRDLARTLDDRMLFAGEACHDSMFATCHGAMLSGLAVGKKLTSRP